MAKMSAAEYYAYVESLEVANAIATLEGILQAQNQDDEDEQDDENE